MDNAVKNDLYNLQKTYSNRFMLANEHWNYDCLNYCYIDCYGNIHENYQLYPSENTRCFGYEGPCHKIPNYEQVKESFRLKKFRYQQAKLDLETERELERMKYNATDIPTDQKQYMFQNIPSYHNKRVQRKLHTLESELQRQFEHHIQAEKERENLSRKLHLLNKKDRYHQTKSSIAKKLNDNITTNVWKEKELVRNVKDTYA